MKEAQEMRRLFHTLDMDQSENITLQEFKTSMDNEIMAAYMISIGLELHDVEAFFETVCGRDESVNIDEFVEGCMSMRGAATALDVQKQLHEARLLKCQLHEVQNEVKSCTMILKQLEQSQLA